MYINFVPNKLVNFVIWFGSTLLFVVIGFFFLLVLKRNNIVSDFNITKREERPMFFFPLLVLLLALTFLNFVWGWNEVANYLAFMTFTYAVAFTITLFFKISIHVLSVTLTYLLAVLAFKNILVFLLFPLPIITGWTRWHLKKHTMPEIMAGLGLPMILTILWVLITLDVTTL
ncbi:MAG: hypothetical protein ABIC57_04115 [bacterium]